MPLGLHDEPVTLSFGEHSRIEDVPVQEGLAENQFVYVDACGSNEPLLCRVKNGFYRPVPPFKGGIYGIKPEDEHQRMALDLLMDDDVTCVAICGVAGSGKNLLTIAAGLEGLESGKGRIMYMKPTVPVGKDIGFLPGTKEDKLLAWYKPLFDNLRVIQEQYAKRGDTRRRRGVEIESLSCQERLELEIYTYIRGRSLNDYWVVLDETQNIDHHTMLTALTRVGYNTKVVILADMAQIDDPALRGKPELSGFAQAVKKLGNSPLFGVIELPKSHRSDFARFVGERMAPFQSAVGRWM